MSSLDCLRAEPGGRALSPHRSLRIWVVGVPAAGKSTLARRLAGRLGCKYVELDAMYWGPGWRPHPLERFVEAARHALSAPSWVTDGQYAAVVDKFAPLANYVIWLDPPLWVTIPRLVRRTVSRLASRTELWAGNRESVVRAFGPKSIIWYALAVHSEQRHANRRMCRHLAARGAVVIHAPRLDADTLVQRLTK